MFKQFFPPLFSGTLFGAGLALGGMTDPDRVRGFLDGRGCNRDGPRLAIARAYGTPVVCPELLASRQE